MWFKNLQIYRLGALTMSAADLAAALAPQAFTPCTSAEMQRQGFAAPRDGDFVHVVDRQWLIAVCTEAKVMPKAAIDQVLAARCAEIEEQQGFAPGRKARQELRERVIDEMLPRAFSTRATTHAWIDPVNGWLVIDAASPGKADNVVRLLLKAVDRFPLESLRVQSSPVAMMTAWLADDIAPYGLTVDQDTELRATGESKAAVRYVKHSLDPEDVRRHIAAGKRCTRLAMTWNSRISFTLTESLTVKGVRPLDVLQEGRNTDDCDGDFALMSGELARMLADLVEALGGEARA